MKTQGEARCVMLLSDGRDPILSGSQPTRRGAGRSRLRGDVPVGWLCFRLPGDRTTGSTARVLEEVAKLVCHGERRAIRLSPSVLGELAPDAIAAASMDRDCVHVRTQRIVVIGIALVVEIRLLLRNSRCACSSRSSSSASCCSRALRSCASAFVCSASSVLVVVGGMLTGAGVSNIPLCLHLSGRYRDWNT